MFFEKLFKTLANMASTSSVAIIYSGDLASKQSVKM